jgi:hypothetical protein
VEEVPVNFFDRLRGMFRRPAPEGGSSGGAGASATIPPADYWPTSRGRPPRGIRNNNPGNVLWSEANDWRGQVGSEGGYCIFDTAANGIRAMAVLLRNYRRKYGLHTIEGLVGRYAPPQQSASDFHNDTAAYIKHVCEITGIGPRMHLADTPHVLAVLVAAMIRHENGAQPYPETVIRAGVAEAFQ